MENLHNLFTIQELKFLIIQGTVLFGLCQYNKTELAWIFLIFPIIYSMIQNGILYIHVSSAIQNAPEEQRYPQVSNYAMGMSPPLLGQGPAKAEITTQPTQSVPTVTSGDFNFSKPSNPSSDLLGTGFGTLGGSAY